MNLAEAKAEVTSLLGESVVSQVTEADWTRAAAQSLTFDPDGVLPGAEGYVNSYDEWWFAAELVSYLEIRASGMESAKKLTTADGDSIEVTAADLGGLSKLLRSRSPLTKLLHAVFPETPFVEIRLPSGLARFVPTSETNWLV